MKSRTQKRLLQHFNRQDTKYIKAEEGLVEMDIMTDRHKTIRNQNRKTYSKTYFKNR